MLELPEVVVLAEQINQTLKGKRIKTAIANQSAHKFAWYTGDPATYGGLLAGKPIGGASACAGNVEIKADNMLLVLSTTLRYHAKGEKRPPKHQLLLEFGDGSALSATVQMWGVLFCFKQGQAGSTADYQIAQQRVSPLSDAFDRHYFDQLFDAHTGKLSAKAFLATEQRIPGLGNGVLQDILWTAKTHPKRKMAELSPAEIDAMYAAVKSVLLEMTRQGGRDTERDLFGCPVCDTPIRKEAYLGGSIYYCPGCQLDFGH